MYKKSYKFLHHIETRTQNYVPDEIIITTKNAQIEPEIPHYLNVASATTETVRSFENNHINSIFQRLNLRTKSIARVFIPENDIKNILASGNRNLSTIKIENQYNDQEKNCRLSKIYRVKIEDNIRDVKAFCYELEKSPEIESARPNYLSEVYATPTDSYYNLQWGHAAIQSEAGWEIEKGLDEVKIAIVDSGISLKHPDLMDKIVPGFDFVNYEGSSTARYELRGDYFERDDNPDDEDGHGTHCAGIAAALSDNGQGITGVCWRGKILPVRVMFRVYDRFGQYETSVGTDVDIDAGIKFAIDAGADVINLSLGGASPSHQEVLDYAYQKNVCVIAATGNENSNQASYPASNSKVLAVGAINENLQRAEFSNYGPAYNRFVMAPGVGIASTFLNGGYVYLDGTSMATPFVTGLAALVISVAKRRQAKYTVEDVYEIIRESAVAQRDGKGDVFFGEGIINVKNALELAQKRFTC